MGNQKAQPFISFGTALRTYRERANKTQAEVSGAVEIEQQLLEKYEIGELRPTEDILILLIQHFQLKDEEASELWRLAGYFQGFDPAQNYVTQEDAAHQNQPLQPGVQQPIVYTDMIQVMVNNYGVIIQFMQGAGVASQPLAIARVGMSKEHAKSVLEVLKKTLEQADEKQPVQKKPLELPSSSQEM